MAECPEGEDNQRIEKDGGHPGLTDSLKHMESNSDEGMSITSSGEEPQSPLSSSYGLQTSSSSPESSTSVTVRRRLKNITFGRKKKSCGKLKSEPPSTKSKKGGVTGGWAFRLCARTESCGDVSLASVDDCICTSYKKKTSDETPVTVAEESCDAIQTGYECLDCNPSQNNCGSLACGSEGASAPCPCPSSSGATDPKGAGSLVPMSIQEGFPDLVQSFRQMFVSPYPCLARLGDGMDLNPAFLNRLLTSRIPELSGQPLVHTQVDYVHHLVPDMLQISRCSFYWGKMDRYEAERLLENRPEGTFLLRDSAQDEHLFSVSFRRFDRSLHARIEQLNDRFSFDSHDPGVFSSPTVCGLMEHYKEPSHCMFFEPMLTLPLHRNFPFQLKDLCRAVICSRLTYDSINHLLLPKRLKGFLKEYHYKQQVRIRRLE